MLWMKQIMFFMDIIRDDPKERFWDFSYRTIVKLLDLSMNFPAVIIALVKMRILYQSTSLLPAVALCIIIWYFLFQSLWILFMFLQGNYFID